MKCSWMITNRGGAVFSLAINIGSIFTSQIILIYTVVFCVTI